jgi:hypothetical protein
MLSDVNEIVMCRRVVVRLVNTKFYENKLSGSAVVAQGQTDLAKLVKCISATFLCKRAIIYKTEAP